MRLAKPRNNMRNIWNQRGVSASVFTVTVVAALLIACGLAVDGAAAASARRRAEAAAAQLARVGEDAATGVRLLAGDTDSTDGAAAAGMAAINAALANYSDIQVSVTYEDGVLRVQTRQVIKTTLLQLIGIDTLTVHGVAVANVSRLP
jgi:hypothetical protein